MDEETGERPDEADQTTRRVTAVDVASRAGVSRVAVSRAFTAGARIAAATREKVLAAAADLGYRPNALARQLNRSASEIVAFVGGSNGNLYYAELIDRLLPALQQDGIKILYVHVDDRRPLAEALYEVAEYPVACTVVATGSLDRFALPDRRGFGPIVLSGPAEGLEGFDAVGIDSGAGIRLAVDHLVARGRRRLACLSGPRDNPSGAGRAAAFEAAVAGHGLAPLWIHHGGYTIDDATKRMREIVAGGGLPDGIVCGNDTIAFGVLNLLRGEAGIAVPDQVAVIGFDDTSVADWPAVALTTIANPIGERVAHLSALVRRRIAEPNAPVRRIVLQPRLVVRGTT